MLHSNYGRASSYRFLRNISVLAFGTVASQALLFATTPLLTRLFTPADFGKLAVFTGISTIAAIVTTGRYEHAIALPETDEEALKIVALVLTLGIAISGGFILIILACIYSGANALLLDPFTDSPALMFLPLYTCFAAAISAAQYWCQRKKNYGKITQATLAQAVGGTGANLVLGWLGFAGEGLIVGTMAGQLCAVAVLSRQPGVAAMQSITLRDCIAPARRYANLPKYMIVSDLAVTISQQAIPIVFSFLFSSSVVGTLSIASRMVRIPSIVFTSSIATVFRNDAIDALNATGTCRAIYISALTKLSLLCGPIFIILGVLSPCLFSLVFGPTWVEAGQFARIMCLMAASDFIAFPLNTLFNVFQRQKAYMIIQIISVVSATVAISVGYAVWKSPLLAVALLALNGTLFNVFCILTTLRLSKLPWPRVTASANSA